MTYSDPFVDDFCRICQMIVDVISVVNMDEVLERRGNLWNDFTHLVTGEKLIDVGY